MICRRANGSSSISTLRQPRVPVYHTEESCEYSQVNPTQLLANNLYFRSILKDPGNFAKRAAMLILYTFCLRFQEEDFTFIQSFIQQHLRFKPLFKKMPHLREVSPSQANLVSPFPSHFISIIYQRLLLH